MKKLAATSIVVLIAALAAPAAAQILPPGATPTKLTPANNIVGSIAINFTEGALYDGNGGVFFSDLHAANNPVMNPSRILRYDIANGTTTVADLASGGTNGMYRDASGNIFTADRDGQAKSGQVRQISRRSAASINTIDAALVTNFNGTVFNGPNDLVVDSHGGIYFTDPDYDGRGQTKAAYYLNPLGSLSRFLTANNPNGIILSPSGKTLYVAIETDRKIIAYDVSQDEATFGTLSNQRQFATMTSPSSPDGITIDPAGNVYAAGSNSVWAWNPDGVKLFQLNMPAAPTAEDPTNVDFGGADGKTLFITAGKSLYSVHLNIATPSTGDYTGDGVVDAADYIAWRDTLGSASFLAADGNGNHVVDAADFDVWAAHFGGAGSGGQTSAASAPEPSTLFLLAASGIMLAIRRLVRRHPRQEEQSWSGSAIGFSPALV